MNLDILYEKKPTREPGYYWVKELTGENGWEVAEWTGEEWLLMGRETEAKDDPEARVWPHRIIAPGERFKAI